MEKINIAKLLKDCPKGMELDCTIFENLTFEEIDEVNSRILCNIQGNNGKIGISFNKFDCYSELNQAKCVIFPKGKTTWEGFVSPCQFKDGDVISVITDNTHWCGIYKKESNAIIYCYVDYSITSQTLYNSALSGMCNTDNIIEMRLATEEEKQKLFDVIKANGYKWNTETKTLEKLIEPKFKVGDKIIHKHNKSLGTIALIDESFYHCAFSVIPICDQDEWELVPNKFDITTLKPFESRVLVRSADEGLWKPAVYGFSHSNGYYVVGGACWKQCIPHKGNEHLRGTTNACDDFYKTWEK